MDFALMLAYVTGTVNQELLLPSGVIDNLILGRKGSNIDALAYAPECRGKTVQVGS